MSFFSLHVGDVTAQLNLDRPLIALSEASPTADESRLGGARDEGGPLLWIELRISSSSVVKREIRGGVDSSSALPAFETNENLRRLVGMHDRSAAGSPWTLPLLISDLADFGTVVKVLLAANQEGWEHHCLLGEEVVEPQQ